MKSPTQIHKDLVTAGFPERLASGLVGVLQDLGVIQPGTIGDQSAALERLLEARPFRPFTIEMEGKGGTFEILDHSQCGFNRNGTPVVRTSEATYYLNSQSIARLSVHETK